MTFAAEKFVTARKTHKCGECFRVIQPGEGYFRGAGNWEGDFWHMKWCLQCDRFRDIVLYVDSEFWQQCYGGLGEWVAERLYVEIDSSFSWTFRLHVNRLQSLFRQHWAGLEQEIEHAQAAMQLEKTARRKKLVIAG
ncbi:hypothetical protein SEA_GREKAYCON_48 [Arthrobacter phage Grekaycon]|uniref:Uncharacterized protein n=1 Tax=Arthrobacter phage Grekaycon TaxID=2591068 RepID=A0A514A5J4_9CAUD|nr:hypothetical protein SEA_GREKAYCON_48 [Arthrobacter phage Grekaycon]